MATVEANPDSPLMFSYYRLFPKVIPAYDYLKYATRQTLQALCSGYYVYLAAGDKNEWEISYLCEWNYFQSRSSNR